MIIETVIELSEAEKAKIEQNKQEESLFRKNLHSLINGDKKLASRPLVIGKTPNIFSVCEKSINVNDDLVITKKVIEKCMRPELRDKNGRRLKNSGHYLSEDTLVNALNSIKMPVMVLKGNSDNTLVAVTEFKDEVGKEIIVPIEYKKNDNVQTIINVASVYGRDDFSKFIEMNIQNNNILAVNIEKANEMFLTIGRDFPEAITFISFDNSIAYSTANVKYISENFQNFSEKEKPSNEETERNDNVAEKKRLFVDMDGTLAEFKVVDTLERLYEPHYFERLKPNESVVEAVKDINRNHPEIEVYILSAVLTDSKYALYEKKNWIKEHLPEIPEDRCIFPPCGSDKKDFIPEGIRSDDFLLDDYSLNLNSWEPPARGIKLLNGINGNNGTWDKDSVSYLNSSELLSEKICSIINNDVRITEQRPQDLTDEEKFIAKVDEIAEWNEEAQAKAAERQAEQEKQGYNR